jgi:23S rRNA (cytosine1962-C5)-methyltransferase
MGTSADGRAVVRLATDDLSSGPWVYGRHVAPAERGIEDGSLVEVIDESNRFLGHALYNAASDIRLRWLSRGRKTDLDRPREFLLKRLKDADTIRRRVLKLPDVTNVYRVAHAEGDDLPGLIVDRMNDILVCEHHALGFWKLREDVQWALEQLYPGARVVHRIPQGAIDAENYPRRELDQQVEAQDETLIEEHGLRYEVRPGAGHKTGWFCDQRDNRLAMAQLAQGRDVLDICCNAGGFALQAFGVARPGALVASFSCSGLLQESQFIGMLFQAARRAGRGLRLLGAMEAGPDHPQRPDFSRSRYLKGALLALD